MGRVTEAEQREMTHLRELYTLWRDRAHLAEARIEKVRVYAHKHSHAQHFTADALLIAIGDR